MKLSSCSSLTGVEHSRLSGTAALYACSPNAASLDLVSTGVDHPANSHGRVASGDSGVIYRKRGRGRFPDSEVYYTGAS